MGELFQHEVESTAPGRFVRVALERGLENELGLTYRLPAEAFTVQAGDRVRVPLGKGNRPVFGFVLEVAETCDVPEKKIKPILGRDPHSISLPPQLLELARWIGRYYCCPLGMVFASILPAAVKKGIGTVNRLHVQPPPGLSPQTVEAYIEEHRLRAKQAQVLRHAAGADGPLDAKALADHAGARSISPVKQLLTKGHLIEVPKQVVRASWGTESFTRQADAIELNGDQQRVLSDLESALRSGFSAHLLHGVTGSGKTEVYIRLIERAVAAGRRAIVLVPEISLTPQTISRFVGRFDRVAVLHSGLTAAQRHEQWSLIRRGEAQVIVGARSAIFAPTDNIGLIVVDEEHDGAYKQDQAPRYHARDVAVKRGQMENAMVLLGSATPSLESYHNAAERGVYRLHRLERRVGEQSLPRVDIVDLREERRKRYEMTGSAGYHLLSLRLEKQLQQVFGGTGQAILLLNRRGYANYIACPDHQCGWIKNCEHCDVAMVYHRDASIPTGGVVRCHYCSYENLLPSICPVCAKKVTPFGLGTQRVEDEIARKFPAVPFARMDSDNMRTGKDYAQTLNHFRQGHTKLLLGTQMIAKGLDFPNVRLVGVISADTALSLPDFRSSERAFQLICQVAGRSGRSREGGTVIVQTFTPDHAAIQHAARHDYHAFAAEELAHRRREGLPPYSRMARIVCRDKDLAKAQAEADELAEVLRRTNEQLSLQAKIRGPHPAAIARIAGYFRIQIQILAADAVRVQHLLTSVRKAGLLISDARTAVDVDPIMLI